MIDRKARNDVIAAFDDYLDDKITAFEFDEQLQDIETNDQTVGRVIHAAWFHYDDCKDHKVCLSKPEWDYFQRLLLVLRSDAEFRSEASKRWSWDHAIAWATLAAFIGITVRVGWGWHLLGWTIPFGIVSIWISIFRRRRDREPSQNEIACMPFESFSQIRWFRHRFPDFSKRKYRPEIGRPIRSRAVVSLYSALSYGYWLAFSPLVLLFQGFPSTAEETLKLSKP
jgi:hypothetical protein